MINFSLLQEAMPTLLRGASVSLQIALFSCLIGVVLGTILGIAQTRKVWLVRFLATLYAIIIRGTPMLIQIFFMRYGLLPLLGVKVPAFWTAVIAIGLNSAAYISQVIRAGILSINKGQIEAAKTLGFSQLQAIRFIVLPQAFRKTLPALGNELITLVKDSSLAYTIGVAELFKQGVAVISRTYEPLTIYLAIAAIYLVITSILSILVNWLYRKLNPHVEH